MKKSFEFAGYRMAAVIAKGFAMAVAVALLAGCSGKEYVGELGDLDLAAEAEDLITFNAGTTALTRAPFAGADAAAKLSGHFVVYGTKHPVAENGYATNDKLVFNNYNLSWKDGSAGTSLSNTSGWEYVGNTSYSAATTEQSIKYWDYGATAGYTFYAFSSSDISYPARITDQILVSNKTTGTNAYNKGYTVTLKNGANLQNLYFSDRKPVAKADFGKPVKFTFRSFGAKVRVGFYETIPGYKIKINRFYYDILATSATTKFDAMTTGDADNFRAAIQNVKKSGDEKKIDIVYNSENRPSVVNSTVYYDFNLKLGNNLKGKELGTTSATATYDTEAGAYTDVFPFEQITNPMLIKCDFTMEAEDGQGETYEISGARVVIPVQYLKWSSNCCYTYLFKITENFNGTTGKPGTDPEGLYSISFDAMSVSTDVNDQTTLTSVDKFSITNLRQGMDVYLVNTDKTTGSIVIPTKIGDETGNAQIYVVSTSGAAIDEVNIYSYLTGNNNGISLEPLKIKTGEHAGQFAAELVYQVPAPDGSYYTYGDATHPGAVHYTAEYGYAYAYVYCATKHMNPTYAKVASDATWSSTTTYYTYSAGVYSAASGITAENFEANKNSLYIQSNPGTPGEYAVMLNDLRGY